ncbi:hypothetical protein OPV22_024843 [Ensete ventricosum]|uniref:Uncharacterized protein n=1 Tax=Ensete ventricosum TaxID=4639 RepID=A0AAV8Q874_ENSVE|nr:hypothetical protein OPV22_024843 [Ensete ventricosum]
MRVPQLDDGMTNRRSFSRVSSLDQDKNLRPSLSCGRGGSFQKKFAVRVVTLVVVHRAFRHSSSTSAALKIHKRRDGKQNSIQLVPPKSLQVAEAFNDLNGLLQQITFEGRGG